MIIIVSFWLLLVSVSTAHAGFLIPLLIPFVGTFFANVIGYGLAIAGAIGLNYAASKLLTKTPSQEEPRPVIGGAEFDLRVDADVPQALIVGRAVTAGSLVHCATYGAPPGGFSTLTINTDMIEFVALADHPCVGLVSVYVDGVVEALNAPSGDRGQAVASKSNLLWTRFFDGAQTAADPYAVARLGSVENNPWTAEFVGVSRCYARNHYTYNQEKCSGLARWKYVVDGARLYDPRKDSTVAGGSGPHRFDDLATHEFTRNPIVIAYNILRGIYVAGDGAARQFFYGVEGTAEEQLPAAEWFAAMNACDAPVTLAAGGTEPAYTCGGEISVDTEPREVLQELLKCCGGRLVEAGGVFKPYVGAPGLPVLSFADGDLLADREDTYRLAAPLHERVNHITAKYTSPAEDWIEAVAPPRENLDWRAEDGRRLSAELHLPMVQSVTQVERLQSQLLNRLRRQRRHMVTLPPYALGVEPGDTVEWNSDRNGYVDKLFEVDKCGYDNLLNVVLTIIEVDPADYDWSTDDELPPPDGGVPVGGPEPKVIGGFAVSGIVHSGDGTQRPAIRLAWDDPVDGDLIGVTYELRTVADAANIARNTVMDAGTVAGEAIVIIGGLQSVTQYQVRARFISANGYTTEWSLWLAVTTPDARFSTDDFGQGTRAWIDREIAAELAAARKDLADIAAALADTSAVNWIDKKRVRSDLVASEGRASAAIGAVQTVAVGTASALAAYQVTVTAQFGDVAAAIAQESLTRADADSAFSTQISTVSSTVNGLSATVSTHATAIADINGQIATAYGVTLDSNGYATGFNLVNGGPGQSTCTFLTDNFRVAKPGVGGGSPVPVFDLGTVAGVNKLVLRGDVVADRFITTRGLALGAASALDIEQPASGTFRFDGAERTILTKNITIAAESSGNVLLMGLIEFGTDGVSAGVEYGLVGNLGWLDLVTYVKVDGAIVDYILIAASATNINVAQGGIGGRFFGTYSSVKKVTLTAGAHTVTMTIKNAFGSLGDPADRVCYPALAIFEAKV